MRLALVRAVAQRETDDGRAVRLADALLLNALAADLLGLADSERMLSAIASGRLWEGHSLARRVSEATGLPPEALGVGDLPAGDLTGLAVLLPQAPFELLHGHDDPFGTLGQRLRSRRPLRGLTGWILEADEARRNEGGYYTPYRLARRLATRLIGAPEANSVPSLIDPSCGAGTFLAAAFDVLHASLAKARRERPLDGIEPVAWSVAALHGVELNPTALLAARLSVVVRAVLAERGARKADGQMALFGHPTAFGRLVVDRLRLGDSLSQAPQSTLGGTERLRLRLLARDAPGRMPATVEARPIAWDAAFPLRWSDDEGTFLPSGGFEHVLTNPPFVPVDRIEPERRRELMQSLATAQRRFDLFIGFVERSLSLLAPGGRATLLIPRTFLSEANAERCRRLLLERATLERIEDVGMVPFEGARVECIALTFASRRAADATKAQLQPRGARRATAVPHRVFRRTPRAMFRLELADPDAVVCLRLAEVSIPLGRYFCASWGARGTPVSDFHLTDGSDPLARPMLKGDDVQPFLCRASSRWLLYDPARLYRPSHPAFFESEKVVVRKVTGVRGLVAAVDPGGHYTDDSLACVVRKADLMSIAPAHRKRHGIGIGPLQAEQSRAYGLHLLAALFHSPLVQTYYRVQLGGGLNVFPGLIEALPLPRPERLELPEAARLEALGRAAAAGEPFDSVEADGLARTLFGLPPC